MIKNDNELKELDMEISIGIDSVIKRIEMINAAIDVVSGLTRNAISKKYNISVWKVDRYFQSMVRAINFHLLLNNVKISSQYYIEREEHPKYFYYFNQYKQALIAEHNKSLEKANFTEKQLVFKNILHDELRLSLLDLSEEINLKISNFISSLDKEAEYKLCEHKGDVVASKCLDDLELTVRLENILVDNGIISVKDLCEKTEHEIKLIPNLADKRLREIKDALECRGLKLKEAN
jgi:hypothetical protein